MVPLVHLRRWEGTLATWPGEVHRRTVRPSGAQASTGTSGQGAVIHTGGSTAGGGEVTAGSHGTSVITGAQGNSSASGATSVGTSHASANVDQHSAIASSVHAAPVVPNHPVVQDHSVFDQSSHAATDYSSHTLRSEEHTSELQSQR